MAQIKKITVSLTEDITVSEGYQFAWVKNTGSDTLYISGAHGVLDDEAQIFDRDVATIKAGEATMVTLDHHTLYCYCETSTTAEVHAQGIPTCPFKIGGKGGGSSVTVESLSVTENNTYTAPSGKAYSPVSVSVSPNVNHKYITQNDEYYARDDGLDGYSSVIVSVPQGAEIISYAD